MDGVQRQQRAASGMSDVPHRPLTEFEVRRSVRELQRLLPRIAAHRPDALPVIELWMKAAIMATPAEQDALKVVAQARPLDLDALAALATRILAAHGQPHPS